MVFLRWKDQVTIRVWALQTVHTDLSVGLIWTLCLRCLCSSLRINSWVHKVQTVQNWLVDLFCSLIFFFPKSISLHLFGSNVICHFILNPSMPRSLSATFLFFFFWIHCWFSSPLFSSKANLLSILLSWSFLSVLSSKDPCGIPLGPSPPWENGLFTAALSSWFLVHYPCEDLPSSLLSASFQPLCWLDLVEFLMGISVNHLSPVLTPFI